MEIDGSVRWSRGSGTAGESFGCRAPRMGEIPDRILDGTPEGPASSTEPEKGGRFLGLAPGGKRA